MSVNYILRRRSLGRTSAREIARNSQEGILVYRNDGRRYSHENNRYERVPGGLPETDGYVFRWGCTSEVPGNPKIINKVAAINEVNNKALFRKKLADAGLAPKTSLSYQEALGWFNNYNGENKVVVRRAYHAQGRHLHVCSNDIQLHAACARYGSGNYYISELINKTAEYRVCVAFGRVAWVANKRPHDPSQVAWNVAQGGSAFENVQWNNWPLRVVKTAVKAMALSSLDIGGVDVMVDAEGKCYVLEINSAMSLTSPYRQQSIAKVFDYVVRNGRDHIPLVEQLGDWKKFIHPALSEHAILSVS